MERDVVDQRGEVGVERAQEYAARPIEAAVAGFVEPILVPEADFEQEGFMPNVVFPTGVVDRGDTLLIYYGAADAVSAVVELSKADVLAAMQ